ncbi:MAG: hypothetical protein ABJ340_07345, partial [Paraglaciecola sp.]
SDIVDAIISRDPSRAKKAMMYHIGDVDDEMEFISNNPEFIRAMDVFNAVISEQSNRRNASRYNGKLFVGNRVVF